MNTSSQYKTKKQRVAAMFALVVAGEAVFFLPFVIARVFRPTFLEVFGLTNLELGLLFSIYGIIAMASYFFGGPLADKFQVRKLMSMALLATASGGFLMATIPDFEVLKWVYGFWGITTILLFWAALIRATREWGGDSLQGSAFGLLDAGRGLAAATVGSVALVIFSNLVPEKNIPINIQETISAFKYVILFFSAFTLIISALVWFAIPASTVNSSPKAIKIITADLLKVIKMPTVWLQALIIVCAYAGYKITDDYSLFGKEVLYLDDVAAAGVGTMALWIRPVAAFTAGYLGDKFNPIKMILICFGIMIFGGLLIGSGVLATSVVMIYLVAITTTSIGVFGLRGLYFAIMGQGKIPLVYTGTAVGIISVVGFTPDIFMGPLMGILLDQSPGALGHRHVFLSLAAFSTLGLTATMVFQRISKN